MGHFLLTNLLLPKLLGAAAASGTPGATRIVNVTSRGYLVGPVHFSDPNFEKLNAAVPAGERWNAAALKAGGGSCAEDPGPGSTGLRAAGRVWPEQDGQHPVLRGAQHAPGA